MYPKREILNILVRSSIIPVLTVPVCHTARISFGGDAVRQGISEAFLGTVLVDKSRTNQCPLPISPRHLNLSSHKILNYLIEKGKKWYQDSCSEVVLALAHIGTYGKRIARMGIYLR